MRCRRVFSSSAGAEDDEDDAEAGLDAGSAVLDVGVVGDLTSGNGDEDGDGGVLLAAFDVLSVASAVASDMCVGDELASATGLDEGLEERLRLFCVALLPKTSVSVVWLAFPLGDDGERFMEEEAAAVVVADEALLGEDSIFEVEADGVGDDVTAFCNAAEADEEGELELVDAFGDLEERRLTLELASLVGGVGGGSLRGSRRLRLSSEDDLVRLPWCSLDVLSEVLSFPAGERTRLRLFLLLVEVFLLGELEGCEVVATAEGFSSST